MISEMRRFGGAVGGNIYLQARRTAWAANNLVEEGLETLFDRRRGTMTAGREYTTPEEADTLGTVGYSGSRPRELRFLLWVLQRKTGLHHFDQFIDIGAGKGKACIVAAESGLFSEVLAVENHPGLVSDIQSNALASGNRVIALEVDARECGSALRDFHAEARVLYLYNPFSLEILEQFLDELETVPGMLFLIYNNGRVVAPLSHRNWRRIWHWSMPFMVGRPTNPMSIWARRA